MNRKNIIAAATVAAISAGGAGAIAATNSDKAAEKTVLSDAAKQLGVSSSALKSALSKAEDAQLDAQVKAGTITKAQADAIKQHRQQDGTVLGLGHGDHGGFDHHGGGRFLMTDAAKAIGISETKLFTQLRGGKTLEQVAKANGKTLAGVKSAVRKSATDRLDADLKAGRITKSQHDEEISELGDEIANLGTFADHDGDGPRGHFGAPPAGAPSATPTTTP